MKKDSNKNNFVRMKVIPFLCIVVAMLFVACSKNEEVLNEHSVEAKISGGISLPQTRANGNQWETDKIGVMAISSSLTGSLMPNLYKNVAYSTVATGAVSANFTPENGKILFQQPNETVTFAAYGPYQTSTADNTLPGNNGVINNNTLDQNTREKQKALDYIYASGATASKTNPNIQFKEGAAFAHKMARMIIVVTNTHEEVIPDDSYIRYISHQGSFNVATGIAKAEGGYANYTQLSSALRTGEREFTFILYPQKLKKFQAAFQVGGWYYSNQDNDAFENLELLSGYSYKITYTIKVRSKSASTKSASDRLELKLESFEVSRWE